MNHHNKGRPFVEVIEQPNQWGRFANQVTPYLARDEDNESSPMRLRYIALTFYNDDLDEYEVIWELAPDGWIKGGTTLEKTPTGPIA